MPFRPARILMQDFTGVPAVVDLAAMRDGITKLGGSPDQVNPLVPGRSGDRPLGHGRLFRPAPTPLHKNVDAEFDRNGERYALPALGPGGVRQLPRGAARRRHLPPGEPGVPGRRRSGPPRSTARHYAYPDTLFGTDSHTTMVNGIGVLGWGVGGIEAEAAMLGQPIAMLIPDVIGFRLTGKLPEGSTATDLALTVTQMLRKKGVVGKFVEFFGAGPGRPRRSRPG